MKTTSPTYHGKLILYHGNTASPEMCEAAQFSLPILLPRDGKPRAHRPHPHCHCPNDRQCTAPKPKDATQPTASASQHGYLVSSHVCIAQCTQKSLPEQRPRMQQPHSRNCQVERTTAHHTGELPIVSYRLHTQTSLCGHVRNHSRMRCTHGSATMMRVWLRMT